MAIGIYSRLGQAGIEPGRDLSVVGFRQNPQLCFLHPTLASFAFDVRARGKTVGKAMVEIISNGAGGKPERLI